MSKNNDFEDLERELDQLCEESFKNKPNNNLKNPYDGVNVDIGINGKVNLNKYLCDVKAND